MKKHLCMAAAACGLLSLASCSEDENVIMDQPVVAEGEQIITLDVQNTDVLSTKSRPLYSTENKGAEEVTDVALLIFKMAEGNNGYPMTLENVINISRWDQLSTKYSYGRQYSYKLEGDKKLEAGSSYTIIAVGQNETESDVISPYKIVDNVDGSSIPELTKSSWTNLNWNASATIGDGFLKTVALDEERAGEIFSGTSKPVNLNISADQTTGFNAEVLLKRQVAGVIGYFSQIPAYVNVGGSDGNLATRKIRLVASAKNTRIDLTRSLGDQSDDATGEGKTESVVNGYTPAEADAKYMASTGGNDAYTVYEINLADWFTRPANSNQAGPGYWGYTVTGDETEVPTLGSFEGATWKNGIDGANDNPRIATNAVLAGEFVIPFEKSLEKNTFELQLIGNNGTNDVILRKWNVKLDAASKTDKDADYVYNIYRNHLYQIGQRGGGDSPVDPGKDPDEPQPLDNTQDLTIKINDNWEIIHDMVIE